MTDPARTHLHVLTDSVPRVGEPQVAVPAEPSSHVAEDGLLPPPVGWSDPLTGTDGPNYWQRVISTEEARIRRYHRSATIAIVAFDGLDELAERWGRDVATGMFVKLAGTLAREVRSSDSIARVEPRRFGILLTETNEVAAINFVERARSSCEAQRGLAANVLRVGFGWASLSVTDDLPAVLDLAERRLAADLAGTP
jgi:diguanylate cyclase (GGDEF)-like protein